MIAIVFALKFESAAFREPKGLCSSVWTFEMTGRRCAAALDRSLCEAKPDIVVSAGFGGGLQPDLPVGSIVVGENASNSRLVRIAAQFSDFRLGKIATSVEIVESGDRKRSLGKETGALSVDCETDFIRLICKNHKIPLLCIRCISDAVDHDLPFPGSALISSSTGRPNPSALFRYVVSHPSCLRRLSVFFQNARTAQRSLASGLSKLLKPLLKIEPPAG